MSTRTGFPRMDWDTGFLADPKFQHLRDLLPDPIQFGYAGFCFLRLTADAWRTCKVRPIEEVVRGIEPWAVEALVNAGLLDTQAQLPTESFEKWVGAALEVRKVWREKKEKSPGIPKVSQGNSGTPDTLRIGTVGQVDTVGTDEGVQGEDAVWTFLAQHGAYVRPDSALGIRLVGLLERRGAEVVMTEAKRLAGIEAKMSDRQWVLGLENAVERVPSGRIAAEAAVAEIKEARSNGIFERMMARRMEEYGYTGKWREEWGPMPEGLS